MTKPTLTTVYRIGRQRPTIMRLQKSVCKKIVGFFFVFREAKERTGSVPNE